MKALRLVLRQTSANYRKEETIDNKMTYPLPPISTIIGALHQVCGYREYHPMDVSIQGNYGAMHREPYTDYCFLNSVMDDRGILVKMANGNMLSRAFQKVASAKKSQGNSFRKNITIQIHDEKLYQEYIELKELGDQIKELKESEWKPKQKEFSAKKKELAAKKKTIDKKTIEYQEICDLEKQVKQEEETFKQYIKQYEEINYKEPISLYKSLTTSLKFYEVLDEVNLIIHVKSDESTMNCLMEHIYNLKSLGRSEDFVDIINAEFVELSSELDDEDVTSHYAAYIPSELVRDNKVLTRSKNTSRIMGTQYYLNKKYEVIEGKRIFEKVKVYYISNYLVEDEADNIFFDNYEGKPLIVSFL